MHIVVCIKQVPATGADKRYTDDLRLDRTGVEAIINPLDEYAIEQALRLVDDGTVESVTYLSMGPDQAAEALRGRGLDVDLVDLALLRAVGEAMSANGYSPDGALVVDAADALAAERARADQAEQRIADAWDEGAGYAVDYSTAPLYDNPYRSEATA